MKAEHAPPSPPIFARNTSGLLKEFRLWDIFVFNVLGYALGLVLTVTPTFVALQFPHINILALLIVGVIMSVFNGLTYGLLAAAMPRSGGDYVFVGRVLHPSLGFVANWGFTCSQVFGIGIYAYWCVTTVLAPVLVLLGHTIPSDGLTELAKAMSTSPTSAGIVAASLVISVGLLSLFGMRLLKSLLNALFLVALLGLFIFSWQLFTSEHGEFVQSFDTFVAKHSSMTGGYSEILRIADTPTLSSGKWNTAAMLFAALPLGYWIFLGFTYSAYIGGEVRQPQRSQTLGMLGALAFGFVVYALILGRYDQLVGRDFVVALTKIGTETSTPLPAGNSMLAIAGVLFRNPVAVAIVGLSFFLWYYLLIVVMVQICVRNIFAWALDRMWPDIFVKVSARTATPLIATLATCCASLIVLIVHCIHPIGFINYIALFSVCAFTTGIAAIAFPFRRRELYERSHLIVQRRIFGVPLISVCGTLNCVLFAMVLVAALTRPDFSGVPPGAGPIVGLIVTYGTAVLWYVWRVRRAGVRADVLRVSLPPD